MKIQKNIQKEVDLTVESLEGVQKATPAPFLFTRIKARMDKGEKNVWNTALSFFSRPTVALATIALAISVNAVIFIEIRSERSPSANEEEQLFANEYNLANITIYDSTVEPE